MKTFHIHINGIVQGVGFRPVVYQLAVQLHLDGYVKNGHDGLHIYFNSTDQQAKQFFHLVQKSAPRRAMISSAVMKEGVQEQFAGFTIKVPAVSTEERNVLMSPDIALCSDCRKELKDEADKRYRYPFVTCTQCGPRYSILKDIPFERCHTAMHPFSMCNACKKEYDSVNDKRFFSQTNSCETCGIELTIEDQQKKIATGNDAVLQLIKIALRDGKVVAVKGVGGYLLLCDAADSIAVQKIRSRKKRPAKPFAVLYSSMQLVQKDFYVNKEEQALLESEAAPVVLLRPQPAAALHLALPAIAPLLKRVGVMLPCSPLLELIAADFEKPLIATSANISGSPIIYTEDDALEYLSAIADYIVSYNRDIIIPEDDSVVQVTGFAKKKIILRRSRGYAPAYFNYKPATKQCILAAGALLKSSFTLGINHNVFISQFLGSGESFEAQQMYQHTLHHWLTMYDARPAIMVADKHPGYFSQQLAAELAMQYDSELLLVQHHEAHFAAVLAENGLLEKNDILGVIWDGTGLGDDGNIWGGEFFSFKQKTISRLLHFGYFPSIAGDKTALQPRLAALCAAFAVGKEVTVRSKFTKEEWKNYTTLAEKATLKTSSAGRLFDAVASSLQCCDKQTFEGEAAMYLQALAEEYTMVNGLEMDGCYWNANDISETIPIEKLINGIINDLQLKRSKSFIAARFHYSLAKLVYFTAAKTGLKKICFSGGVFQNALLVDYIIDLNNGDYELYFHKDLSPNDENVSFGQFVFADQQLKSSQNTRKPLLQLQHV